MISESIVFVLHQLCQEIVIILQWLNGYQQMEIDFYHCVNIDEVRERISVYKKRYIYWHILYVTIVLNWHPKLLWWNIHMQYIHAVYIHMHLHTHLYSALKSLQLQGQYFRITGTENFLLRVTLMWWFCGQWFGA